MYVRSTLFIAAALLVSSTMTAGASDLFNGVWAGSTKDAGGIADNAIQGVPVPRAFQIQETVAWYIRGDVSYGFSADVDVAATLQGIREPDGTSGFGVGFGRYLSPNTRFDITIDYRRDEEVFDLNGTTQLASHTALANYYYEFDRMGGFRPYVGAGIGIALHEVDTTLTATNHRIDYDVGFAVAGHAGVSLDLRDGFALDAGYRVTYQSGDITAAVGPNNVIIGDRLDHEIRVGFRYDIQ